MIPVPPEYLDLMQQTPWFPSPELVGPALMIVGILLIAWKLVRLPRATPLYARPPLEREGWSPMLDKPRTAKQRYERASKILSDYTLEDVAKREEER